MPKSTGLGDNFYLGGVDLSGDINSLGRVGGGPSLRDITGNDKKGMERLGGVREGAIEFVSLFNADAAASHPTLALLPRTDVLASYYRGQALGNPAANCIGKQVNYDVTRNEDGDLRGAVSVDSNSYGVEWGYQLTAGKRTDGSATSGTGVDLTSSSAFGLQAYLHVFSVAGTSVTVKIQESSDNAVGDPYADVVGGAFAAVTPGGAPTFQRIATATGLTVERWLRVVTTGTFSSAVFAVVVTKNRTLPVF
jgi:hypothetical protein